MNTGKSSLTEFLNARTTRKAGDELPYTHTKIGSEQFRLKGGSYHISESDLSDFWKTYHHHVFVNGHREFLTERQYTDRPSQLLVDLDFKFGYEVTERQHTDEIIRNIVIQYTEVLTTMLVFPDDFGLDVFVMHKAKVNRLDDKGLTKDGIHIIFGLNIDTPTKLILRQRIIPKLQVLLEPLALTNSMDDVVDLSVCRGSTNWQVYGSRKPGNEPYELTHRLMVLISSINGITLAQRPVTKFNIQQNIHLISARYLGNETLEIAESFKSEHASALVSSTKNTKMSSTGESKGSSLSIHTNAGYISPDIYGEITDLPALQQCVDLIMASLTLDEYYIKETHDYTQILPDKFYRSGGSHDENTKLAFALKHTDDRLFLSWVMVRSKSEDFSYSEIPLLKRRWDNSFNKCPNEKLTRRSIIYWAKQENPVEYERILTTTSEYYINESLTDGSDWDLAMVVYQLYKDKYICSNTEHRLWYTFNNHKWTQDHGATLRTIISTEVYKRYKKLLDPLQIEMKEAVELYDIAMANKKSTDVTNTELNDMKSKRDKLRTKVNQLSKITDKLKNTLYKNHILTEAATLFYDPEFSDKSDANPNLLCFSNGVWDFTANVFRRGIPQDYITKSTNIPFIPIGDRDPAIIAQIHTFMQQLFPSAGLNKYMWQHLASCLVGVNKSQTFNMYIGSGSNGKSKLTDLMSKSLGDYKGSVPIALVTDKRPSIGGTSSEIINLKGIRYAVMQEPTKSSCTLNEGVMKEITGSDPITARGLYKDSETFTPQLTLVVCSNILFEINSTDNGTWRRIRICNFGSKFLDKDDYAQLDEPKDPSAFVRDYELDEKITSWAPTFVSTLVDIYVETNGMVQDCVEVMSDSKRYRDRENHANTFILEMMEEIPIEDVSRKVNLGILEIYSRFKQWFVINVSSNTKAIPKRDELKMVLEARWKRNASGWNNIRFKTHTSEESCDAEQFSGHI